MNGARKATKKLAFDLVDVYARRAATQGYRFSPGHPLAARDGGGVPLHGDPRPARRHRRREGTTWNRRRPMDRLVCGDVGFGKTEVALRAAFKATQDGKQVMVLCPTTILAQQHYTTFKDRFEPFGVTRGGALALPHARAADSSARGLRTKATWTCSWARTGCSRAM